MGVKFDQVRKRPLWLYKIAGIRLELDGFCSAHKIAFEYQGEHHYRQVGYCKALLEKVKFRDGAKLAACKLAGVHLLIVPTLAKNWNEQQAGEHVLKCLIEAEFLPVVTPDQIPDFIKHEPEKLATFKSSVEEKGGIVLEACYKGYHRGHLIQCGCGNEWAASPASIFRGCWCPKCGRVKVLAGAAMFKKQKLINDKPKNFERLRLAIERLGGVLLENEYKGCSKPHLTQCGICGHQWGASPQTIFKGSFCLKCGQEKLIGSARAVAKKRTEERNRKSADAKALKAKGVSTFEIAKKLSLSQHTIRLYLRT